MLPGAFATDVTQVYTASLASFNRPEDSSKAQIIAAVATAIGLATLLPRYGINGAAITTSAFGAHAGAQLEWRGDRSDSLAFRVETVFSGEGYVAGYFDQAYSIERFGVPARGWMPKAVVRPPSAVGVRGALDAGVGPVRLGFAATVAGARRPGAVSLYLRVVRDTWALAGALSQRQLRSGSDMARVGPATAASVDASINLLGGLFAFGGARHSFRRPARGDLEPTFDWILGLGYGAQAGQTTGS